MEPVFSLSENFTTNSPQKFSLSRNSHKRPGHKENQTKFGKITLQPQSHVTILIYRSWTIQNELKQHYAQLLFIDPKLTQTNLKSEFAPLQILSRLFQRVQFVKCWQIFVQLNSKRLQSSRKEEASRCFVFTSSTKREIRHFHVVVVQRRQRNVFKRRDARAKLLFCQYKGLFTWSGGTRSSGVGFFCFHTLRDTKQKKLTPLDRGPPLHVNRV